MGVMKFRELFKKKEKEAPARSAQKRSSSLWHSEPDVDIWTKKPTVHHGKKPDALDATQRREIPEIKLPMTVPFRQSRSSKGTSASYKPQWNTQKKRSRFLKTTYQPYRVAVHPTFKLSRDLLYYLMDFLDYPSTVFFSLTCKKFYDTITLYHLDPTTDERLSVLSAFYSNAIPKDERFPRYLCNKCMMWHTFEHSIIWPDHQPESDFGTSYEYKYQSPRKCVRHAINSGEWVPGEDIGENHTLCTKCKKPRSFLTNKCTWNCEYCWTCLDRSEWSPFCRKHTAPESRPKLADPADDDIVVDKGTTDKTREDVKTETEDLSEQTRADSGGVDILICSSCSKYLFQVPGVSRKQLCNCGQAPSSTYEISAPWKKSKLEDINKSGSKHSDEVETSIVDSEKIKEDAGNSEFGSKSSKEDSGGFKPDSTLKEAPDGKLNGEASEGARDASSEASKAQSGQNDDVIILETIGGVEYHANRKDITSEVSHAKSEGTDSSDKNTTEETSKVEDAWSISFLGIPTRNNSIEALKVNGSKLVESGDKSKGNDDDSKWLVEALGIPGSSTTTDKPDPSKSDLGDGKDESFDDWGSWGTLKTKRKSKGSKAKVTGSTSKPATDIWNFDTWESASGKIDDKKETTKKEEQVADDWGTWGWRLGNINKKKTTDNTLWKTNGDDWGFASKWDFGTPEKQDGTKSEDKSQHKDETKSLQDNTSDKSTGDQTSGKQNDSQGVAGTAAGTIHKLAPSKRTSIFGKMGNKAQMLADSKICQTCSGKTEFSDSGDIGALCICPGVSISTTTSNNTNANANTNANTNPQIPMPIDYATSSKTDNTRSRCHRCFKYATITPGITLMVEMCRCPNGPLPRPTCLVCSKFSSFIAGVTLTEEMCRCPHGPLPRSSPTLSKGSQSEAPNPKARAYASGQYYAPVTAGAASKVGQKKRPKCFQCAKFSTFTAGVTLMEEMCRCPHGPIPLYPSPFGPTLNTSLSASTTSSRPRCITCNKYSTITTSITLVDEMCKCSSSSPLIARPPSLYSIGGDTTPTSLSKPKGTAASNRPISEILHQYQGSQVSRKKERSKELDKLLGAYGNIGKGGAGMKCGLCLGYVGDVVAGREMEACSCRDAKWNDSRYSGRW